MFRHKLIIPSGDSHFLHQLHAMLTYRVSSTRHNFTFFLLINHRRIWPPWSSAFVTAFYIIER